MKPKQFILFPVFLFFSFFLQAQQVNIPLHSWRTHFSYQSIYSLAVAGERVYAAAENGLFYYDREDNSTTTLSSLQGLSDAGISALYHHPELNILLITYRNGNLDLLEEGRLYNIRTILEASLPGNRHLNDVQFSGNFAYLATDYGISVLNLQAREINESFFNLGPGGNPQEILQLAVWNDSLYALTEIGLMANALQGANLADYNSWKRFSQEGLSFSGEIQTISGSRNGLFAGVNGEGLFNYSGGIWSYTGFNPESPFRSLEPQTDGVLAVLSDGIFFHDFSSGTTTPIASEHIKQPYVVKQDNEGAYWIADGVNGLISNKEGSFQSYIPNGPIADVPVSLFAGPERVVALFQEANTRSANEEALSGFSVFANGSWKNYSPLTSGMPNIREFSDGVFNPQNQRYYFSSLQGGLLEWDPSNGSFRQFRTGDGDVSLRENQTGASPVSALAVDGAGQIWMLQPGTGVALHRYNPADESWEGYLENHSLAERASELVVLQNGDKWLRLAGSGGLLIFNEREGQTRILGKDPNRGGLTNEEVTELEPDLEGQLWVGMAQGISYFPNPYSVLGGGNINAALPVYEGRALLNSEEVSALAVDGGNRKWIGTPAGLWVFGDYGDTLYHHFTTVNSPLPDNLVLDIAIEQKSGEAFVATQKGIVSFRSGATEAGWEHAEALKIYPNPVYPTYQGKVGITGLARDVVVKITDVSGKLIKELAAEGGTASWDLTDTRGRRPATGVYFIYSSSADGIETLAGKMAIIR